MIKNFKENFRRNGNNIKGRISNTEFCKPILGGNFGRGISRYRINDRFLILSTNHPKIEVCGGCGDYIIALHLWGKDKSKDNILIDKDFPNKNEAIKFMNIINKLRKL